MALKARLDKHMLIGVTVTNQVLGHGSYATVLEVKYMGLKCAGKKIHELLIRHGDSSYPVCRFEEECHLLSQVHHPNIVQFLGVYFQQTVQVPILVIEYLPTNLTSCIEQYGIFPNEISYSVLHDVALGLCYLHSQTPAIIHRDLSFNNVLLTPNMTAKISDLGVARILNLTPLQVSHMTQTPGTPAYMPPEVMIANPKYDTSVDEFSFGVLIIHIFSGRWPEPQVGPNQIEPKTNKLIPVTEAERHEVFLRVIGNNHPLMDLILSCVNNNPRCRPNACEIVERISKVILQFPASFANQLEKLRRIEADTEKNKCLREEYEMTLQQREKQLLSLRGEIQQKGKYIHQQILFFSSELECLKFKVRDLISHNQLLVAKYETGILEMKAKVALYESQVESNEKTLQQEKEYFEIQLGKERELIKKLTDEIFNLQSKISQIRISISTFQQLNLTLKANMSRKDATIMKKDSELEVAKYPNDTRKR